MTTEGRWKSYVFGGIIIVISATASDVETIGVFGFEGFLSPDEAVGFGFWALLWALGEILSEGAAIIRAQHSRYPVDDARRVADILENASAQRGSPKYHNEPIDAARLGRSVREAYEELLALDGRPADVRRQEVFERSQRFVGRLEIVAGEPEQFGLSNAKGTDLQIFLKKWTAGAGRGKRANEALRLASFAVASTITALALVLSYKQGFMVLKLVMAAAISS
ncbi:MAG: hypothetical protein AAGA39_00795 [Pseudomonadota bacterium]